MLAATSPRFGHELDSVRLILTLETQGLNYSDTLREYLFAVLRDARELLDAPSKSAAAALPEAISLAFTAQSSAELRDLICKVIEHDGISQEEAEQALSSLEAAIDPNIEPAHLSPEAYAAI